VPLLGIALPKEVSALPTSTTATPGLRASARSSAVVAPPADSDYGKAQTFKYVSERSLSQFDILNTIFNAMAQTHYDDPAVLNQGAYSAMVVWEEKNDKNQDQKRLVKWFVESARESATTPNVVKAWFRMPMMDDQLFTIQVKMVIETAPTQGTDGSYTDYGVWRMDAKVLEAGMPFHFVASAARGAQGRAVVKMGQVDPGKGGTPNETRGVLIKSAGSGAGKVVYPDWEACNQPDCVPASVPVAYVYDAQIVTLRKGAAAAVTKDRHSFVDIVNRYGLFDATTGADVAKSRQFGFPIRATGAGGVEMFGYYGAWQGRHQLWGNGSQVPGGITVQRADVPPNQVAPTYTTSTPFTGILVKRSYAQALLSDLAGLAVETWDNVNFQIGFDGKIWCKDPVLGPPPQQPLPGSPPPMPFATCTAQSTEFTDFASMVLDPSDMRRNVMIMQPAMPQPQNYVYENGAFYPAAQSMGTPHPVKTSNVPHLFAAGDFIQVNIGGPIYISWDGSAWVKKTVATFDMKTWTPAFAPGGDSPYQLQADREYYFNNSGTNYVVKLVNGVPDVRLEIQAVAHPWDAAAFVPVGTTFEQQWCSQGGKVGSSACSTFSFVTDAASPDYMKLVYATVGDSDLGKASVGAPVQTGMWGLQATVGGSVAQFNWDFPMQGQDFGGAQQYLVRADGSFVQLDDPIRLDAVSLVNAGATRTFTLQFDGNWMQGLPNVWDDLRTAGFQVDDSIKSKAFSVPTGTVVGTYIVKQLQVSQYMSLSPATPLDLAEAAAIDLDTVPTFVDHGMGAIPDLAPLKYSEGNPVAP
jgi:hypothetical protein